MYGMAKTTSINLRISPEFRREIELLAAYHGLSMSSYAHSLLVKSIRRARDENAEAFESVQNVYKKNIEDRRLAPVVATISPANDRREAQAMIDQVQTATPKRRSKVG